MTEDNPPVEIAVLGPLLVRVGGVEQPIPAAKQRLLLARLAVQPDQVVTPDQLVDALWGETPPTTATKNLQVLVGRLRTVLGPRALVTDPAGYRLDTEACSIDGIAFERLVEGAGRQVSEPNGFPTAIGTLTDALALWRGDVAPELAAPWGGPRVGRWSELRRIAQERLLTLRVSTNPSRTLVAQIRQLVEHQPHQESLRVLLVHALQRAGDLQAARIALDEALLILRRDLGLAPGNDLTALAAEFGVRADGAGDDPGRAPSALVETIGTLGPRFLVADVVAAVAGDTADADVLDELEAMVDRGELARSVDDDGRVQLMRTNHGVGGEDSS